MGKVSVKKTRSYTSEDLDLAISRAKSTGKVRAAAKAYGIPFSTLQNKLAGKYATDRRGPKTILTPEEEQRTVSWIQYMAKAGFPVMLKDLYTNVKSLAQTLRKKGRDIPASFPCKF